MTTVPLNSFTSFCHLPQGLLHSDNRMYVQPSSDSSQILLGILTASFSLSKSDPFHSRKRLLSVAQLAVSEVTGKSKLYISPNPDLFSSNSEVCISILLVWFPYFLFPVRQKQSGHSGSWHRDCHVLPAEVWWSSVSYGNVRHLLCLPLVQAFWDADFWKRWQFFYSLIWSNIFKQNSTDN